MQHLQRIFDKLENVRRQGRGWRACCPVHDDSDSSLSISLGQGNRIILNCHACGADKRYCEAFLRETGLAWRDMFPSRADRLKKAPQIEPESKVLTEEEADFRNQVYSRLSANTHLIVDHYLALRDRGLSGQHAQESGYFSVEAVKSLVVGRLLYDYGDGLYDVPGFRRDVAGRPAFAGGSGLFIPVRDSQRRIIAGQIRTGGNPKYIWLRGSGSPYHVPLSVTPGSEVWITEGPLKADIAALLGGLPLVAVAGVGSWRSILPALTRWGTSRVTLAFDADSATNPAVEKQERKLAEALRKQKIEVSVAKWPIECGKGIDDLIASGHKSKLRVEVHADKPVGAGGHCI